VLPMEEPIPPVRLIVFDWDGTLSDSTTAIAESLQAACRDLGFDVPDDLTARHVIGLSMEDALLHVAPRAPVARHPEIAERYHHHYVARANALPLFDGVRDLLSELEARGFLLAIATGKSRRGLARVLDQHGIGAFFVATRCADEGFAKPHPGMLEHLMDFTGMLPRETLMIGDTTHDLQMARAAGAWSIGVSYGAHPADLLAGAGPLAVVDSVAGLAAWVRGLPRPAAR
jgi:phosphoglycolate phosphatase